MSRVVEVVRTYLELRSPQQLRGAAANDPAVRFVPRPEITASQYRRLYHDVGNRWHWHDRDAWSDEQLATYLASPTVAVTECLVGDETAGYFELVRHEDDSVEIAYFGLVDAFIGRGLGKAMLTRAAEEAWSTRPSRVWLHTCTLDSPHALPNYRARGFEETRKEVELVTVAADDARADLESFDVP